MKKKIIVIATFIFILIIVSLIIVLSIQNNENVGQTIEKDINKLIEKKKDKIIYVYNSVETKCAFCKDVTLRFDYYIKEYQLDVLKIDIAKLKNDQIKEISNLLNLDNEMSSRVNIVYMKKGQIVGSTFGEITSEAMALTLYENGYITEENYNDEQNTMQLDVLNSEGKKVILIGTNGETINTTRSNLKKYLRGKKITINYLEIDLAINGTVRRELMSRLEDNYKVPMIIYINDGKIINYTYDLTEDGIKSWIESNKI